jgi:hypothetical protein
MTPMVIPVMTVRERHVLSQRSEGFQRDTSSMYMQPSTPTDIPRRLMEAVRCSLSSWKSSKPKYIPEKHSWKAMMGTSTHDITM